MTAQVTFSDSAVAKIREIMEDEDNDNLLLRVFVQGGGCAGFQYGFTLEDEFNEDDVFVEHNGMKAVVDTHSLQYLAGSEVDYIDNIMGSQFQIANPQAKSTCGCGSSFSVG